MKLPPGCREVAARMDFGCVFSDSHVQLFIFSPATR
jgi:hypothetical protein